MEVDLHHFLQENFTFDTFREGQEEIICDVLRGENVLGMLKTGSGKSLCYQLPARLFSGLTIVVSPLISLMIDQVREAKAFHFKEVVALHSMQTWEERQAILQSLTKYKLLYISPELLQQQHLISLFRQRDIALFVIDEAHCISQWGHDFRPDFLRLRDVIIQLGSPPVLALTGTATEAIQLDIQKQLGLSYMQKHIYQIDRENIALHIEHHEDETDKLHRLIDITEKFRVPTIIYFTSRKMTEQMTAILQMKLSDRSVAFYHGGMDTVDRLKVQQQFLHDQIDIICCTSAFGMGINKKNIRIIIHYHIPANVESFIQEIGRAGRDGKESVSVLLYKDGDVQLPLQILEHDLPNRQELMFVKEKLLQYQKEGTVIPNKEGDIEASFQMKATKWRFLYFQLQYRGMMDKNIVFTQAQLDDTLFYEIDRYIQQLLIEKRKKVVEMIDYVQHTACLREKLYNRFNQEVKAVQVHCCSHCHFHLDAWQTEQKIQTEIIEHGWQQQLATLLLVKDHVDETIRTY